ncbi:amidoligase family protein [Gallaecimonas sp. GXIMD4217]|uniref:amidoligase family protein n=1 Tax=Gallaecimonas sp. GXIMD4217 TaxID=3131927 RepID=UPI00311AEEE2
MPQQHYCQPQRQTKSDNSLRRVGFELEFAGVELKAAAWVLARTLNGRVCPLSEAEYQVHCDDLGTFNIELDWTLAKDLARQRQAERPGQEDPVMELVTWISSQLVPIEVVCPPLPLDRLHLLDPLVASLREAGAQGTEESLLYAFGVHINPELPALDADTITGYLQAFILAQDWLIKRHRVDPVRRITPYIDAFPEDYALRVSRYEGNLDLAQLMDDYLWFNPTRNRALDLLPLFKHLDGDRVAATLDDPRIKARPTFHYRLPNCEIEKPGWSLHQAWNLWCVIEHLACHHGQRRRLLGQWWQYQGKWTGLSEKPWHKALDQLHQDLLSA